jgi:3-methyladenine DNA glycosylase AlkC
MAEALKNMYNREYLERFADAFVKTYPGFDRKKFLKFVFDNEWESKELKARMRHITVSLNKVLPEDYQEAIAIMKKTAPDFGGFLSMIFPDYVEVYGLEEPEISIPAMELFTQYGSSEFAIRPFIIKYKNKVMLRMLKWARHKNHNVRRLASEGCRPRLPWAIALPEFKKDPKPVLKILEVLKNDSSEYVRRSVANNLNDISKDHPMFALETAKKWYGKNKNTDRIVKHGLRGLLKKGNKEALKLFGYHGAEGIKINGLSLDKKKQKVGGGFIFSFKMKLLAPHNENVRVEYTIDFITSRGKISKKIFKIAEGKYMKGKEYIFSKRHSLKNLTTRKHFKGRHKLAIIINGEKLSETGFIVV